MHESTYPAARPDNSTILPYINKLPLMITAIAALSLFAFLSASSNAGGEKATILFFGDSITAGYGLDPDQSFPALIQDRADSLGIALETVNAGVSGETTAGGLRRVDWVLQRPFDIFVLGLGGNDGLRGLDPDHTRENLQKIMDKVRENRPGVKIVLAGMEAPPNMGDEYTLRFRQVFQALADANDVVFMPFLLEDVAGIPEYHMPDGIHPTAGGHRIIAGNVWKVLEPLIAP
jgi:acyl-CoA thioesterase I